MTHSGEIEKVKHVYSDYYVAYRRRGRARIGRSIFAYALHALEVNISRSSEVGGMCGINGMLLRQSDA